MLISLFLDILYCILYNLVFILFSIIELVQAKRGKSHWGFFTAGLVIQGIPIYGMIANMIDDNRMDYQDILSIISFSIFVFLFAILIKKSAKMPPSIPQERYNRQESEMKSDFQGYIVDESTGEVISEPPANEVVTTYCQPKESIVTPSPFIPSKPKFQRFNLAFPAVCAVLLVCIGILGYHSYSMDETVKALTSENAELNQQVESLKSEISALTQERTQLLKEKEELQTNVDTLNDTGFEMWYQLYNIGFIVNGSPYYHRFDCSVYTSADSYLAHNTTYCEAHGYKKCPLCWQ